MYKFTINISLLNVYKKCSTNDIVNRLLISKYCQSSLFSSASSSASDNCCGDRGNSNHNYDIIKSHYSNVEIPDESITEFLFKNIPKYADRPAIVSTILYLKCRSMFNVNKL